MNVPTNKNHVPVKDSRGFPVAVVVPIADYVDAFEVEADGVPSEVVNYCVRENLSFLAGWRLYKGLSQAEMAKRLGRSQSSYCETEKAERPRKATLQSAAKALEIDPELLIDLYYGED